VTDRPRPHPLNWFIGRRPVVAEIELAENRRAHILSVAAAYPIPSCTGPDPQIVPPLYPVRVLFEVLELHLASGPGQYVVPPDDGRYLSYSGYRAPLRKVDSNGRIRLHLFPAYRST